MERTNLHMMLSPWSAKTRRWQAFKRINWFHYLPGIMILIAIWGVIMLAVASYAYDTLTLWGAI